MIADYKEKYEFLQAQHQKINDGAKESLNNQQNSEYESRIESLQKSFQQKLEKKNDLFIEQSKNLEAQIDDLDAKYQESEKKLREAKKQIKVTFDTSEEDKARKLENEKLNTIIQEQKDQLQDAHANIEAFKL